MKSYWDEGVINAIITDYSLDISRGFALDLWLYLDYGGFKQGFGGFVLHKVGAGFDPKGGNYAGHYITRVMEIAGVEKLKDLKGKTVRVDRSPDKVKGIGHIVKGDWFYPSKEFSNEKV